MFKNLNFQSLLADSLKENLSDLHLNFLDDKVLILGLTGPTYKKLSELIGPQPEKDNFLKDLLSKCSIDPTLKRPQDGKIKILIDSRDITVMLFFIPLTIGPRIELRII